MAGRTAAELEVKVTSDVKDTVAGFDAVKSSAGGMETAVKHAGDTSADSARKLRVSADAADELGGKAGKATGALGALSSGFELVGAEKYATGLQAAGMATDFFSGVGDSLNLVMESTIIKTVRAKAATVAHAVTTKAAAIATGVMTGAQWALNVALNANPISLIVIAIIALTAGLVLAYKKSETFRNVVNTVFAAVKKYIEIATLPLRTLFKLFQPLIDKLKGPLSSAFKTFRDIAKRAGDAVLAPFRKIRDLVKEVVDWISKIKLPDLPNPGGGVPFVPGIRLAGSTAVSGGSVQVIVQGDVLDADALVAKLETAFSRRARRFGG